MKGRIIQALRQLLSQLLQGLVREVIVEEEVKAQMRKALRYFSASFFKGSSVKRLLIARSRLKCVRL